MTDKIYLMLNIALFPFKDLNFYNSEYIRLRAEEINSFKDTSKSSIYKENRERFENKLYKNLLLKCPFKSLDEVNLLLEKYYPFLSNNVIKSENIEKEIFCSYFSILEGFTKALLSHRDGELVYKHWKSSKDDDFLGPYKELDKVHIFNLISRFIPIDILVASYYSINHIDDPLQLNGFYQQINLADAPLDDVLVNGVAENHIHASSAFDFSTLWYLAMNDQTPKGYFPEIKPSQYTTYDNVKIIEYILTAQILRIILAKFLFDASNTNMNLYDWINSNISEYYRDSILNNILGFQDEKFLDTTTLKSIVDSLKKDFNLDYGDSVGDILFSIFKDESHIKTYGENILLQHSFKYKKLSENSRDSDYISFCNIFFKYIAIKNEFYQEVTQSSTIKGLSFFKPYFDRATDGFDKKNDHYYSYMLRTLFQNPYLKKVELRLSIMDKDKKNKELLKKILTTYRTILETDYKIRENPNAYFPRIGIIYHLIKLPDDIEKCWCMYNESDQNKSALLYYKKIQDNYLKLSKQIVDLRKKIPYLANFILGIDAASLENHTPVQVFAPVFEQARNSDCDPVVVKDRNGNLIKNQSLFFTFHAGEDFRHLNSGLRRIDEVIDYCKFHSGDRIGHGIALGVKIETWVKNNPVVILPRSEYLDNLLWIWGVYSKNSNMSSKAYIYLEQKIHSTAKEIFQCTNGLTSAILYESYTMRFDELKINSNWKSTEYKASNHKYDFCINKSDKYNFYWDSEKLYHAYHCKCHLQKLTEPIYINTSDIEEEMTVEMQKYLIKKLAMNGIVVEVNPTSNFAIGEVNSVYNNQFFNISSSNDEQLTNILINVNSDNPMVFNTNVSNEIAYLYYGMLERGIGKESALKWIDKIRKSGMDTSFIRNNISNVEYIHSLDSLIDELCNTNH